MAPMQTSVRDASPRTLTHDERALVERLEALVTRAHAALPDVRVPCWAALTLETAGKVRTHLFGPRTVIHGDLTVLDGHHAPLASVLFGHDEGEPYEIELDDRTLAGCVLERVLLDVEDGRLLTVERPSVILSQGTGGWSARSRRGTARLVPRSADARKRSEVARVVPLDASQRRAVELAPDRSVLVLGEAGFGKTTVALHRLAWLEAEARRAGREVRSLVVVPTKGLLRLSRLMLDRLGVRGAEVSTFDGLVRREARRIFADIPGRDSVDATAAVIQLKRSPALRAVLPKIAARRRKKTATRKDLLHLFGDRALMEAVVEASDGALSSRAVTEVLEHTHVQFSRTTEHEHRHVDRDHLVTSDGRPIDEGTPLEDAESIDTEDCAVLFELERLRGGPSSPEQVVPTFDHVVVDEAQELAPIELAFLARTRRSGGTIIVAGDENQQTDGSASFVGWDGVMAELGVPDHARVVLEESYRSPPEVTAFARTLMGARAPRRLEAAWSRRADVAVGASLAASLVPTVGHRSLVLVEELRAYEAADPRATIAVITRTVDAARKLHGILSRVLAARLALGGTYDFLPGIVVTTVAEMKGLEVDVVVVPDADRETYPATREAEKALYVAVTRALHQVWLVAAGAPSPLVAPLFAGAGAQVNL